MALGQVSVYFMNAINLHQKRGLWNGRLNAEHGLLTGISRQPAFFQSRGRLLAKSFAL